MDVFGLNAHMEHTNKKTDLLLRPEDLKDLIKILDAWRANRKIDSRTFYDIDGRDASLQVRKTDDPIKPFRFLFKDGDVQIDIGIRPMYLLEIQNVFELLLHGTVEIDRVFQGWDSVHK